MRGRIIFPADTPEFPLDVIAHPAGTVEHGEGYREWRAQRRGDRYYVGDLPPGEYVVRLDGFPADPAMKEVTLDGETTAEVDLVVPPPSPDFSVLVRVTGPDGGPVPDLQIRELIDYGGSSTFGGGRSVRLEDATVHRFYFSRAISDLRRGDPKLEVKRWVSVSSSLYGEESVEVPEGAAQVDVRFVDPARVTIAVANWGKTGVASRVRFGFTAGKLAGHHVSGVALDSDGTKALSPLKPGVYTFFLTHPIGRHDEIPIVSQPVTLAAGETRVTLSIPPLHELTASAEGDPDLNFELESAEYGWATFPERGKDGEVTWKVPAGEYLVKPWGGSEWGPPRKVRVPGDRRVVFTKTVPDCYQVTITGAGKLADAGFIDGDYIVGVDGKDFTDRRQMRALWTLALRKDSTKVTVLRGGKRIELTVAGASLRGTGDELGGRYNYAARPK